MSSMATVWVRPGDEATEKEMDGGQILLFYSTLLIPRLFLKVDLVLVLLSLSHSML